MNSTAPRLAFDLPDDLSATEPPEARGMKRDEVRLLVTRDGEIRHAHFHELGTFLGPGDLVVVNTSATLPAAVDGLTPDGPLTVHFSHPLDDGSWAVELRRSDGSGPTRSGAAGQTIVLPGGNRLEVLSPYAGIEGRSRLVRVNVHVDEEVEAYLLKAGRPISYPYVRERWPLAMYRTIFGREPGSAEMPSASRPFTHCLMTDLAVRGVGVAPLVLHTAVSSLEKGESPLPERYAVPSATARRVNETRTAGGRVIAVGTSVVRALEAAADNNGVLSASAGWTELVLGPHRPAKVVDGLVTGWHPPEASHQMLLEAVSGRETVTAAYDAALRAKYLWHEFGDSCLLLPARAA